MRFRFLPLVIATAAIAAAPLHSQTTSLTITRPYAPGGGAVTAFGDYMSPYTGHITGGPDMRINCVDFFHGVSLGDTWEVKATHLDGTPDLSGTRYGAGTALSNPFYHGNALDLYRQSAWLTMQYDAVNPAGVNANKTIAIQTAIWNLWDNAGHDAPSFSGPGGNLESTAWWMTASIAGAASLTAQQLHDFTLYSDDHLNPAGSDRQEFLTYSSTPEPATLGLMLTGLFGVAGPMIRRRRSKSDTAV